MEQVRPTTKRSVKLSTRRAVTAPKKVHVAIEMLSPTQIHKDPNHHEARISASALDTVEWDVVPGRHQIDEVEVAGFWPKPCTHPRCKRPANPFMGTPSSIKGKPAISRPAKARAAGHEYKMTLIVKVGGQPVDAWDPHLRVDP